MPQRPHPVARRLAPFAALLLTAACQAGGAGSTTTAESPEAPPDFRPADPSAAPGAPGDEGASAGTHAITTSATRIADGSVVLVTEVRPGNGYHLNTDPGFPWRVKVADDAPVAAGTTLGSADASRFTEDHASFEIPVTEPGDASEVGGEVVIGVCDDEGCIRVREELTWVVANR